MPDYPIVTYHIRVIEPYQYEDKKDWSGVIETTLKAIKERVIAIMFFDREISNNGMKIHIYEYVETETLLIKHYVTTATLIVTNIKWLPDIEQLLSPNYEVITVKENAILNPENS
jgi:hypothetical protein